MEALLTEMVLFGLASNENIDNSMPLYIQNSFWQRLERFQGDKAELFQSILNAYQAVNRYISAEERRQLKRHLDKFHIPFYMQPSITVAAPSISERIVTDNTVTQNIIKCLDDIKKFARYELESYGSITNDSAIFIEVNKILSYSKNIKKPYNDNFVQEFFKLISDNEDYPWLKYSHIITILNDILYKQPELIENVKDKIEIYWRHIVDSLQGGRVPNIITVHCFNLLFRILKLPAYGSKENFLMLVDTFITLCQNVFEIKVDGKVALMQDVSTIPNINSFNRYTNEDCLTCIHYLIDTLDSFVMCDSSFVTAAEVTAKFAENLSIATVIINKLPVFYALNVDFEYDACKFFNGILEFIEPIYIPLHLD